MKSSRDLDYILDLSENAEDDLRNIQQYTFEKYGERQVYVYEEILNKALATLLHNPKLGHKRPDIPPEYKAYPVGQHVIVFRVEDQTVYVVRVLHGSMDFSLRFPDED
ncbi:MAG: type II toxin-antitoxin system RelE/ParE family toxin [Nitrospinae bacterium]|nr:type II toxin-antitoxin system RelE/ParE family toxin [Nitrospinota bacterium]